MQTLYFEPAWDKTIAPADREKITKHFQSQHFEDGVHFSFLWEATNHKGERLVTVLINNSEETALTLKNTVITYVHQDRKIATGAFTLPLKISSKSSMPWTFIFSSENQSDQLPTYTIVNNG